MQKNRSTGKSKKKKHSSTRSKAGKTSESTPNYVSLLNDISKQISTYESNEPLYAMANNTLSELKETSVDLDKLKKKKAEIYSSF